MSLGLLSRTAGNQIGSFSFYLNSIQSSVFEQQKQPQNDSQPEDSPQTREAKKSSRAELIQNFKLTHRGFGKSFEHFKALQNPENLPPTQSTQTTKPINRYSVFAAAMLQIRVRDQLINSKTRAHHAKPNFRYHKVGGYQSRLKRRANSVTNSPFSSGSSSSDEQPEELPNISSINVVGCGFSKTEDPAARIGECLTPNCPQNFGEDAAFITTCSNFDVFGVCDGVGGWSKFGVDPKEFSFNLAKSCHELSSQAQVHQPVQLLSRAYNQLFTNPELVGSSTACVASFCRKTRKIYTANLGDSGFLIIRDGEIVKKSSPQVHDFNAPFQLSKIPQNKLSGRDCYGDSPSRADFGEFQCESGDVVVLASDGLFDNVFERDLVEILREFGLDENSEFVEKAGKTIVEYAKMRANDSRYFSPFARQAQEFYRKPFLGGKKDDITVVLGVVD